MEKKPSIKINFVFTTIFQIFSVFSSFITAPYVSRVLEVDGIGIYSYTTSVQSYFIMAAVLGTATYGAREISRFRDEKEGYSKKFWEIELLTVFTTSICLIGWIVLCLLDRRYGYYFFLLMPALVGTLFDISWLFNGLEKMPLIVVRNAVVKLIGIVLTFVLVKTKDDLPVYFLIHSISAFLSNISMWAVLPKIVLRPRIGDLHVFSHLKPTFLYFVPTVASSVYLVLDKILLETITKDIAENGYYAQAERIVTICKNVVFMALNSVVGVRISYLFRDGKKDEIKRRIEYSFNYIIFMGFGCVFGIWAVSSLFVPVFYGDGYEKTITVLNLFAPILLITAVSSCLNAQYYVPAGRRTECTKYIAAGAVTNLALNFLLIPRFKASGAVAASVTAELVISSLFWIHSDAIITLKRACKIGWKKLLSGFVMFAAVKILDRAVAAGGVVKLCTEIAAGALIYIIVLILLNDEWVKKAVLSVLSFCFAGRVRKK